MAVYENLLLDVDRGVATVTLNRPAARNAFNRQMSFDLGHAFSTLEEDDDIRAIVVTGAGTTFCAGAELGADASVGKGTGEAQPIDGRPPVGELVLWRFSTPIIAAINGSAVGLGMTYPMQWDIRVASRTARMGFVFNRRGLTPEANSLWLLPRLVGASRALDLLITGRMFTGEEAEAMGLVTQAVDAADVLGTAQAMGRDIADNTAPSSVAITKKLLYRYLETGDRAASKADELQAFAWVVQQPDAAEGIASFFEKRPPNWKMSKTRDLPDNLL